MAPKLVGNNPEKAWDFLDKYQVAALKTAKYPGHDDKNNLHYLCMGLAGESCEALGVATRLAGKEGVGFDGIRSLVLELGDSLWYAAGLLQKLDRNMGDFMFYIMAGNKDYNKTVQEMADIVLINSIAVAAGAVCDQGKKILRDDAGVPSYERKEKMVKLLGVYLMLMREYCVRIGTVLSVVCELNIDKLSKRSANNTINGDGDVR